MKGIDALISIVPRGRGDEVAHLCRQNGLTFTMTAPAYGAAGTHFLDYLGLNSLERDFVLSVSQGQFTHEMLNRLYDHFHMDAPNTGIAMSIPITGVSGPKALRYLAGYYPPPGENPVQTSERKETHTMAAQSALDQTSDQEVFRTTEPGGTREFDLIVTIVNRGFSDQAIEAAKDAGAKGATVLNARGTGIHELEKFFAISIQPEKELILTIVHRKATRDIMHAIIEAAGLQTEGRGLAFSLPVGEVAGIVRWINSDGTPAEPSPEPSAAAGPQDPPTASKP